MRDITASLPLLWPGCVIAPAATARVLTVVALLAMLSALAACDDGNESDQKSGAGRRIEIHVADPVLTDELAFVDPNGAHRVIKPTASNRQLALVDVTIVNRTSTIVALLVDSKAAQLGDRRTEAIDALDPFEVGHVSSTPGREEGKYTPLLWGDVELTKNFQVSGWMVFEVPSGLSLGTFWWREVEEVIIDYNPTRLE